MKLSIRSLLFAIALIAFAIAAISTGGLVASLFHATVGFGLVLAAITAVVGIDRPRTIATGFVVPTVLYASLLFAAGRNEFDPVSYTHLTLPTTPYV